MRLGEAHQEVSRGGPVSEGGVDSSGKGRRFVRRGPFASTVERVVYQYGVFYTCLCGWEKYTEMLVVVKLKYVQGKTKDTTWPRSRRRLIVRRLGPGYSKLTGEFS